MTQENSSSNSSSSSSLIPLTEQIIERFVLAVAELPDRTSPDDWPEAMLVTEEELRNLLRDFLADALRSAEAQIRQLQEARDKAKNMARHNYQCAVHEQLHASSMGLKPSPDYPPLVDDEFAAILKRAEHAEAQVRHLTHERDEARVTSTRMAISNIGDRCEHHKIPFKELDSLTTRECPICWKACAEAAEARADAVTRTREQLVDVLKQIAAHDGEHGEFQNEGIWERKPSPQELAQAALTDGKRRYELALKSGC